MATNIRNLTMRFGAETKDIDKNLTGIESRIDKFKQKVTSKFSLGGPGGIFGGSKGGGFGGIPGGGGLAGLGGGGGGLGGMAASIGTIAAGASAAVGGLVGVGYAIEKISDVGASAAANLEGISDAAAKFGLSTDAYQELSFVARRSGTSIEEVSTGLKGLTKNIGMAAAGNKEAEKKFADLGLSAQYLASLSPEQALFAVGDALAKLPTHSEKSAAAMQLMEEAGLALVPMLTQGSDALKELADEAHRLGTVRPKEDIDLGKETNRQVKDGDDALDAGLARMQKKLFGVTSVWSQIKKEAGIGLTHIFGDGPTSRTPSAGPSIAEQQAAKRAKDAEDAETAANKEQERIQERIQQSIESSIQSTSKQADLVWRMAQGYGAAAAAAEALGATSLQMKDAKEADEALKRAQAVTNLQGLAKELEAQTAALNDKSPLDALDRKYHELVTQAGEAAFTGTGGDAITAVQKALDAHKQTVLSKEAEKKLNEENKRIAGEIAQKEKARADAAKSLTDSVKTAQEKFRDQQKEINSLLKDGLINKETARRALEKAQSDLFPKEEAREEQELLLPSSAARDSSEAVAMINRMMHQPNVQEDKTVVQLKKLVDIEEDTLDEVKKLNLRQNTTTVQTTDL